MPTTGKQLFTTLASDGKLTVEVGESTFPDPTGNQEVNSLPFQVVPR